MRSEATEAQACLPLDLPVGPEAPACATRSPRRTARGEGGAAFRHLLTSDGLTSLGWPVGTDLTLTPCRTPQRGAVVLVEDGVELKIGVFEVDLGRPALRNDHGSVWLSGAARTQGVVVMASPPFADMPHPGAPEP